MIEHAEGTVEIGAPAAVIMGVLQDFERYGDWAGELKAEVLARDRYGRGTLVAFRVTHPLARAAYTLAYRYVPRHGGMSWTYREGTLVDLRGSYLLQPAGKATTLVSYALDIDPGGRLPAVVKRQMARQLQRSALGNLRRRVERPAEGEPPVTRQR